MILYSTLIQSQGSPQMFRKSNAIKQNQKHMLQVEALEARAMLSAVSVFAAGDLGGEQFALQIDGATVQEFTVSQDFATFEFQSDQPISADQISIEFLNDQFDPANGIDSNLIVDAIEIDGVRFETEDPSVFSTGTFTDADGIVDGFGRGETLHTNGFFQFADTSSTAIEISARGDVGNELFNVNVAGETVGTFTASTDQQSFFVTAAGSTTPGDVQIEFLNDQFDPSIGLDSNLTVDFIRVDGETLQTEDSTVFSTGTFLDADGIVDGFGRGETLNANGFLQFTDPLEVSLDGDRTIAVDGDGFQAVNQDSVSDPDGVGAGVALVFDDASGDLDLINEASIDGLGQAGATTVEAGDGVRLAGPGEFEGTIVNTGSITSESTQGPTSGFRAVNGLDFQGQLINTNTGSITGANNGVYFGTGDNSGSFINEGLVSSDSRAVNIDGDGLQVVNDGAILGTGDQRNGTVYSDNTASNFEIVNLAGGLIDAGTGNDGAGVSLSFNNDGSNGEVALFNSGVIAGRGQAGAAAATAGDGIRLEGARTADGIPPGLFEGSIVNSGVISSDSAQGTAGGFRAVNGLSFQGELVNSADGVISGVQNGVYFGTGDHTDGLFVNDGTVTSDSRAVNIDGDGLQFVNAGAILGTGTQRNGTVYADGTADNFEIINLESGLIDAGSGNDGSGIAIETGSEIGDQVDGVVVNNGIVRGQGTGDSANQIGHGLRFIGGAGTDGTAVFTGDVINNGEIVASADNELAAGISIENVGLSETIVNSGVITASVVAIDASSATSSINVFNDGAINGDVLLGASNDVFTVNAGSSFDGALDGGQGFDVLNVNFDSFEAGREFVSSIDISGIERINISGQQFV